MSLDTPPRAFREPDETERVIGELRASLKADEGFAKFMGVEMRDLDQGIAPFVYALWKKQIVKTRFSCSGHTDKFLMDSGSATLPGHFVYSPGFLMFEDIDKALSDKFFAFLEEELRPYPFAKIRRSEDSKSIQKHILMLLMDDIATTSQATDRMTRQLQSTKEVPEELARERLKSFYEIWEKLAVGTTRL